MRIKLCHASNEAVLSHFDFLVRTERKITAEVITYLREVNRRRLYLDGEINSLHLFLVKRHHYSGSAAQRRIAAARIVEDMPELTEHLISGELNLSQVALAAKCLAQKLKEEPEWRIDESGKREMLEAVKGMNLADTQMVFAKKLDLKIEQGERKSIQKDGSTRVTFTLSKKEMDELERVKELVSHSFPNPKLQEVVVLLAGKFLDANDPLRAKTKSKTETETETEKKRGARNANAKENADPNESTGRPTDAVAASMTAADITAAPEVVPTADFGSSAVTAMTAETEITGEAEATATPPPVAPLKAARFTWSRATRRLVYQRDQSCRSRDPKTGAICGSRYQLQLDHVQPIWAGGSNEPENALLLCGVHNRLKYRREAGLEWI